MRENDAQMPSCEMKARELLDFPPGVHVEWFQKL